ncbi:hypothetical protein MA16_Dca015082 [Dendrobium catenatum]|uniref:Uncharacterized protein n=1 Tax=Dendrobium catenatum TaxID=906689 RepID=A0A2I0VMB0_9ASPA|nr:hypothetical protein MA16_Dca015082 [Dendrobium catenatum]
MAPRATTFTFVNLQNCSGISLVWRYLQIQATYGTRSVKNKPPIDPCIPDGMRGRTLLTAEQHHCQYNRLGTQYCTRLFVSPPTTALPYNGVASEMINLWLDLIWPQCSLAASHHCHRCLCGWFPHPLPSPLSPSDFTGGLPLFTMDSSLY